MGVGCCGRQPPTPVYKPPATYIHYGGGNNPKVKSPNGGYVLRKPGLAYGLNPYGSGGRFKVGGYQSYPQAAYFGGVGHHYGGYHDGGYHDGGCYGGGGHDGGCHGGSDGGGHGGGDGGGHGGGDGGGHGGCDGGGGGDGGGHGGGDGGCH
jgi:hypothetical protein